MAKDDEDVKFEMDNRSGIELSAGMNKGKWLYQFRLVVGIEEEEFEFDFRETDEEEDIEEDSKTRDFSINSIYYFWDDGTSNFYFVADVRGF
jgi:tRNA nucleotidyltransferase/poly(A) polymerase